MEAQPGQVIRTFSYGGGVQSTAALVLAAQGVIDYRTFIFCNVGDDSEHPATLDYVRNVAMPYAEEHGITLHEVSRRFTRGPRKGEIETLYGRLTREGSRSLPIPVRMSNGAPGRRACTADFKVRLIDTALRALGATKEHPAIVGLGISIDEYQRMRTDSGSKLQRLEYPLIDRRLNRADCESIIRGAGLPVPPKSSCYFCPFHKTSTWRHLKNDRPDLFQKSVELEQLLNERRAALGKDSVWMSSRLIPLDQAIGGDMSNMFTEEEDDACESGFCLT